MNEILPFIICAIVVIPMVFLILNGLVNDSGWPKFKEKYRYTDEVPVKMTGCQNGLLNQTCFNGMLSVGISDSGIFLRMGAVVFIPFADLELTDKRKYIRYRILRIKGSDLQIGLENKWIKKFPTNQVTLRDDPHG